MSIRLDKGGTLVIDDYFVAEDISVLPGLRFADGAAVSGRDFLSGLNIDITTAAGPEASTAGGGAGEYHDAVGDLAGGVDRLGALGADYWAKSAGLDRTDAAASAVRGPGIAISGNGEAVVPGGPDPQGGQYAARGVLYRTESSASDSLSFQIMQNGAPVMAAAADVSVRAANGWSEKYFDIENATYDPATGRLTLSLLPGCRLPEGAENGYDYVTIVVGGESYVMQLVVNQNGTFDSVAENIRESDGFSLHDALTEVVWGE